MKKTILSLAIAVSFSASFNSSNAADLSEIFKQSQAHDPLLSAAKHTLEASAEGKKQAFAAFLPQVNGSWSKSQGDSETSTNISEQVFLSESNSRGWNVGLSQSLYSHANYQNYKISELQILLSQADYELSYQDFVLRVANTYFNVLSAQDSLVFAKAEEKAIQRQLDQAEQRFEVGLAAITDVHEARARYDSARASVILSENLLQDNNEALFEISQKYYDDLSIVPNDLDYDVLKLSPMDAYIETGIAQNPELVSSQINKDIAEKQIELSKAGHYPTLSLSLSKSNNFRPGTTSTQVDPTTDSDSISLSLNVPIYSGGRTSSQVRQSAHRYSAAMDRYELAKRGTIRKVRNAYNGTLAARSSVQARKLAMVSAQSGLEATEAGYEVGTRTIVDVLNSQRSLYQAQRDYSKAKYDYFIKYLNLKRAAGNLAEKDITTINSILR